MRELVKLASFLLRLSRGMRLSRLTFAGIVVSGILSGAAIAALIAVVNTFLAGPEEGGAGPLAIAFVALLLARPALRVLSSVLVIRLSQHAFYGLRLHLCRLILDTPVRRLEELGSHRLMAGLAGDVGQLSQALVAVPTLFTQFAVIAGFMGYLGWLNLPLLPVVAGTIVVGMITFRLPLGRAMRMYTRARELYDRLFGHFRGVTEGTKELKMHRGRREAFMAEVEATARAHQTESRSADVVLTLLSAWGETLFFVAVGVLLFVAPSLVSVPPTDLVGYVLGILMLRGPVEGVINTFPTLSQAAVAAKKMDQLSETLAAAAAEGSPSAPPAESWRELRLEGVTHAYRRDDAEGGFVVGPVDLAFSPGELVFVVGGNGSGKTTLAKLVLGLYAPEEGRVRLDGEEVTDATRDRYRQHFSVVFADFHLFDTLVGVGEARLDERAAAYLDRLHLSSKVRVEGGRLSTTDLSQGQRKRLALLGAYLEDRPIYLFDEWAADQDPHFKEVFYGQLLPELRAAGKTLIVISHDDRYFGAADRIVRLDGGRVRYDGPREGYFAFLESQAAAPALA